MCGAAMNTIVFINDNEEILTREYEIAMEKNTLIEQDIHSVEKSTRDVFKAKI